jgi:hypothetical protein
MMEPEAELKDFIAETLASPHRGHHGRKESDGEHGRGNRAATRLWCVRSAQGNPKFDLSTTRNSVANSR